MGEDEYYNYFARSYYIDMHIINDIDENIIKGVNKMGLSEKIVNGTDFYTNVSDLLVGKKVILDESLEDIDEFKGISIHKKMKENIGLIMTISNAYLQNSNSVLLNFREDKEGNYYPLDYVKYIVETYENSENQMELENEQQIEIGDLVCVPEFNLENLEIEKYLTKETYYDVPIVRLPKEEERKSNILNKFSSYRNTKFIVQDIKDKVIIPYYINDNYIEYVFTTDDVVIEEKGYLEKIKNKKRKTEKEKKIIDDINIMNEMKSKVDISSFRKAYASSLKINRNDIKGLELLLNQWAYNKKEIYKILGNNLEISQEIEYQKSEDDFGEDRQKILNEFPGAVYVFNQISNKDFIRNELSQNLGYHDWSEYCSDFSKGEKVSKVLNKLFNNEKLNIMYSDIIAQNKMKGTITISIDPIEFLLMSCNKSGWSSCHTIHRFGNGVSYGSFSSGIFSYMCDEVSLIAFKHNGEKIDFEINKNKIKAYSKNWRQMIWLNKDYNSFIASRQYPNYNAEVAKKVRELLEKKISNNENIKWTHSNAKTKIKKVVFNERDLEGREILHYNDVLHNFDCDMSYVKGLPPQEQTIGVGSHPICPICGRKKIISGRPYCESCRI